MIRVRTMGVIRSSERPAFTKCCVGCPAWSAILLHAVWHLSDCQLLRYLIASVPDTLMQDRTSANSTKSSWQRTAGPYIWVISRPHAVLRRCPLCPRKGTLIGAIGMSA
jgi:hypothetical protein